MLDRRRAADRQLFNLIADYMPIKDDAEREHYLEAFRRAVLD
jgi:hypothetical protein